MAKVLVIEDDAGVRQSLRRVLESAGHEVVETDSGILGVDMVAREAPDLVITDLLMPEQEGIETIQRIRERDDWLPIIAISGAFGDFDYSPLDDARLMGADLTLEKPFTNEKLLAAVRTLTERKAR